MIMALDFIYSSPNPEDYVNLTSVIEQKLEKGY